MGDKMVSKQPPQPNEAHSQIPVKIIGVTDVNFPGDEKGNRVATIEANIKLNVEYDQLTKGIINDLILTTSDKLRNQLNEYQKIQVGKLDWVGPLGIVISLIAALVATDFKDTLNIKGDAWEAIFIIALFLSIIWLAIVFYKIFRNRNKRDINYIIQKIKKRENL